MLRNLVTFVLLGLAGMAPRLYAQGELIVFVSPHLDVVTENFRQHALPKLEDLAPAMRLGFRVVEVKDQAPDLIAYTPAIVFQNHLGRSLYVGRYHAIDKVKTFVRTVKYLPQQPMENEKHDVLVWENERATLVTPVKVTDLGGTLPSKFDQEKFKRDALKAIAKGMEHYRLRETYVADRNDRLVYTAFYPYRSEDGKLYISAEVYSQFNCIEPIHRRFDNPFSGNWKDWNRVFAQAGAEIERVIMAQLSNTEKGDGLVPVPAATKAVSWEELGLPLPGPPRGLNLPQFDTEKPLPLIWTMAGPVEADMPVVGFAFPAPLDYYAGELSALAGTLELGTGADVEKANGSFSVEMESLTMGDAMLDRTVQKTLAMAEFPQSSFTFQRIKGIENPRLGFGQLTQFVVEGEFEFMGIKAPVEVTAQMEPVLDDTGALRLQVYASFQLRLKEKYGVKGPDGPSPANDTVVFTLNFLLQPKA